ncbi:uncharacterized protein ATNIH1004_003457 [Aspergillus tanneri]|uniref:Uncharacterized protein n=1 Tax=Aspergillus tanneri TaxID=1220188 RepID=A0A5M9MV57_9EURO|nr:uncharacterized protein ATNIH1004_003457 [Aspergillus tanneri]KAA8650768.1 hypothetical protein ATNIH1004_003457 [Aspergillus tanneri]
MGSSSNNNHNHAIDIPRRPSRSGMAGSERRRSTNLNPSGSTEPTGDSISSSLSHHALRNSSPSSLGGSPIIATGDPHHQRAPSLGELHQELEQEQEAQVNRLLHMIRNQQVQLQQLQQQQQPHSTAIDDSTPSLPPVPPLPAASIRTSTQIPSTLSSRRPSRPSSQAASPSLRPLVDSPRGTEGFEGVSSTSESPARRGSRDESTFYHAEAMMLTRENQMLRQRIRELERQIPAYEKGYLSQTGSTGA